MLLHQVDAGTGIRSVSDDVTETDRAIDRLLANVGKDHLESLKVCMDVADDCSSHVSQILPTCEPLQDASPRKSGRTRLQMRQEGVCEGFRGDWLADAGDTPGTHRTFKVSA